MKKTYFTRLCLAGAVVLFLAGTWESSTVQAAKTWTGETSSEWGTATNWDSREIPDDTEVLTFPYLTAGNSLNFDSGTVSAGTMNVLDYDSEIRMTGGTLTLSGYLRAGYSGATRTQGTTLPTISVTGGTLHANGGIALSTNASGGTGGILNISGTDTVVHVGGYFAIASGCGDGTVNVLGGTVNIQGDALWIGARSNHVTGAKGTFNLLGGTVLVSSGDNRIAGDQDSGNGTLNIGASNYAGEGRITFTQPLNKGLGTATLNLWSGTMRVETFNAESVATNYRGGTFQANSYGASLTNNGTCMEIAHSATADFSTVGTMNIAGNYTQNSGSVTFDLGSGTADKLVATGSVTLNGGKLYVNAPSEVTAGSVFDIMDGDSITKGNAGFVFNNRTNDAANWSFNTTEGTLTYIGKLTDKTDWTGGNVSAGSHVIVTSPLTVGASTFTGSNLTVKTGGNLTVTGRFHQYAGENVASAIFLEDGGTIAMGATNTWFGPSSADSTFFMTGGTFTSFDSNSGLIVNHGSAYITGGVVGTAGNTTQGRWHIGNAAGNNTGALTIRDDANVNLYSLDIGYAGGKGGNVTVAGGTVNLGMLCVAGYQCTSSSAEGTIWIAGGITKVKKVTLGTVGTGTFVQKGGEFHAEAFQVGGEDDSFYLTGGMFSAGTFTGNFVNAGANLVVDADKMTVTGSFQQKLGRITLDIGTETEIQKINAISFDIENTELYLHFLDSAPQTDTTYQFFTFEEPSAFHFSSILSNIAGNWEYDSLTGAVTFQVPDTSVPEPASWLLLVCGLLGWFWRRK
ncbi:MAG: PEP-CTERM sorting domain-containing protein [Planctomycetia bacterium]|nr:PEP-CTERM sorting domain-containing protein [Planctomycetia bacterium]